MKLEIICWYTFMTSWLVTLDAGSLPVNPSIPSAIRKAGLENQRKMLVKRKSKHKKVKTSCPDTCQLKRKIGKVEAAMKSRFSKIEAMTTNLTTSACNVSTNGIPLESFSSIDVETYLNQLRNNLSAQVQAELDENIGELKAVLLDGQDAITATREEVNELLRSIPVTLARFRVAPSTSATSATVLQETVSVMNQTIRRLKQQNSLLRRRTKQSQESTIVIRNQNHVLTSQNRELRLHLQGIDKRTQSFRKRVEDLEVALLELNHSRYSENFQFKQRNEEIARLQGRLRNTELAAGKAQERLSRLEHWTQRAALQEGLALPIPTTTSLPQPDNPPNDCQELLQMGYDTSGVYTIRPWQSQEEFEVYCDQTYYGGGWALIQRRRDGSVDFDRSWEDYRSGFGDLSGEFWLGNEKIHQLTNQNSYRLHIVLLDWNNERVYAEYDGFRLSSSRDYYSARFGQYEGTAGDAMRGTSDDGSRNLYLSRFGTNDIDNDSCRPCLYEGTAFENCAQLQHSGWWYRACADANLNGRYIPEANLTNCIGECFGIFWRTWHEEPNYSLKASLMMLKPNGAEDDS